MPYYFNLPIITSLTNDQQLALDEPGSIALSGGPGTGKSVVCLWRHIRNYATQTRNSLLLTYTKTLEHYLRQSAHTQNELSSQHVSRTYWWTAHPDGQTNYEEIIIDEGQDVSIAHYTTIKEFAEIVSYGADDAQSLYADGCSPAELAELFPENEPYTMYKNFRNSREILEFTRSVFPHILIPQNTIDTARITEIKPILKLTGWDADLENDTIMSIINDFSGDTHNIGILVPSQKNVDRYYDIIRARLDNTIECTKYKGEMDAFLGLSGIHVTTFKSSKGTEFDSVIMPNFDSYDWMINNTDGTITERDYYVAFTRAKTNLFLICKKNPHKGAPNTFEIE